LTLRIYLSFLAALISASGAGLDHGALQSQVTRISGQIDGRVGVCIQDANGVTCNRGSERFSLQSVMKLLVGVAVLDAVETRGWSLDSNVTIRKENLSLYVQPLAKLVGIDGYRTSIGDLVRRAIVDSDSAATDVLLAKLGGPAAVRETLRRKDIRDIRLDRSERDLQTEIVGLSWRAEFVDAAVLDAAIAAVPEKRRTEAYAQYRKDVRDTATPRGMTSMLYALANGQLFPQSSTNYLLTAMAETVTFPNRLKAGLSPGWKIAHKTGTSGSWKGVTAATNDVGILTAPDGKHVAISVFVGDSKATSEERAAVIAKLAAAALAAYR